MNLVNYKKFLETFVNFKTISADPQFSTEMKNCSAWLTQQLSDHGFEAEVVEGFGNPVVIASLDLGKQETCLIYGHYDVQPANKEDGWQSEPFELEETEERLFARGAVDNKGQISVHLVNVFELIKQNALKYNIKFIIEGDEETGSKDLDKFVEQYKEELAADFILVSDGEIVEGSPVIEGGFRGIFNAELEIKTASTDLHSGIYGGAVPNAAHELAKILAATHDQDYKLTIPGIYEDKGSNQGAELGLVANEDIPFAMKELTAMTGIKRTFTPMADSFYAQVGYYTTMQITGLESGYNGVGFRNAIPSTAKAKINFRLAPTADPDQVIELFNDFLKAELPDYLDYEFKPLQKVHGLSFELNNDYVKTAARVLEEIYAKKPFLYYNGAIIPIINHFKEILQIPLVLVPLANEDNNMHAVSENFSREKLEKAMEFSHNFLKA